MFTLDGAGGGDLSDHAHLSPSGPHVGHRRAATGVGPTPKRVKQVRRDRKLQEEVVGSFG